MKSPISAKELIKLIPNQYNILIEKDILHICNTHYIGIAIKSIDRIEENTITITIICGTTHITLWKEIIEMHISILAVN